MQKEDLLPLHTKEEIANLTSDIEANGLQVAVVIDESVEQMFALASLNRESTLWAMIGTIERKKSGLCKCNANRPLRLKKQHQIRSGELILDSADFYTKMIFPTVMDQNITPF